MLATACGASATPEPTQPSDFDFTVQVQALDTGKGIPNARVAVFAPGEPSNDKATDSDGYATLRIPSSAAGQTASLEAEAPGYTRHRRSINSSPPRAVSTGGPSAPCR